MVNLILLLLIAGGFVAFALQNLAPVSLVVLGVKTLALPLSVWVLSFLAAGALTTLILSGFFSMSKNAAVRKSAQRETKTPSPWAGAQGSKPKSAATASGKSASGAQDGWERSKDWDDWAEPQSGSAASRSPDRSPDRSPVRDDIRDRRPDAGRPNSRQTPLEQTGFSRSSNPEPRKSKEVYDAEYRVLIPPYNSTPPAPEPKPEPKDPVKPSDKTPPRNPASPDDEDWV